MAKHTFKIPAPAKGNVAQEKELMDFEQQLGKYGNFTFGETKFGEIPVTISIPDEDEENYNMDEFWTFTDSLYKN